MMQPSKYIALLDKILTDNDRIRRTVGTAELRVRERVLQNHFNDILTLPTPSYLTNAELDLVEVTKILTKFLGEDSEHCIPYNLKMLRDNISRLLVS